MKMGWVVKNFYGIKLVKMHSDGKLIYLAISIYYFFFFFFLHPDVSDSDVSDKDISSPD